MPRPIMTLAAWAKFDPTIFNAVTVPEDADRDLLIDTILDLSSEFGTIYNDPVAIKHTIDLLAPRLAWGMARDWRVLHEEYNPIHNFDRNEEYTDTETASGTGTNSSTANSSTTGSNTSGGTVTNAIKAFGGADEFKDTAKSTDNSDSTDTSNTDATINATSTSENNRILGHSGHLFGNIGVTKSQEMVHDEHKLALELEFYSTWATKYINALCVCVY